MMNSDRWNKINEVFSTWLDLEVEKRYQFLIEACGSDDDLRKEVQQLIDAHLQSEDFIETPVFEEAARAIAAEEDLLQIGQHIGVYKILKEIGRGGMGAVYLAERDDQQYKKEVAIKLIKRGMDTDQVLRRFRNERQILAGFDHPNIARLLEGGSTSHGLPYFVMEYVEGLPINRYCDENNLNITKRLELFRLVCAAVSYAHRNLVIHRDIKPGNILVTADGVPKLLDFGIAKILMPHADEHSTVTGLLLMTPEYASPEQALGGNVTTLSDIYSLGTLLYELLTGHSPYQLKTVPALDVARIITETKPQLPSAVVKSTTEDLTPDSVSKSREGSPDRLRRRLRGDIDNIILMAIRKESQRRYQSVEQFSEDILRHLEGHPVIARKDTFLYRATKFIQRNKVAAVFALLTIIALGIAGLIQLKTNQQARLFQEFGQEVARMGAIMRFAFMMPLHNPSAERESVRNRIESIKKRMTELGSNVQGPGNYAIGRAFMSLRQYEDARKYLEKALNADHYKTTEVAYAYGLTLAMLYQTELESTARINSIELRKIKIKDIRTKFRDPALIYIHDGKLSAESSEFAEAVIQFLDEDYEKAIQSSKQAIQKVPWLYESKRIEGESYRQIGRKLIDQGSLPDALNAFVKAEKAFEVGAEIGASDPVSYEGLCSIKQHLIFLFYETGGEADSTYKSGKEACQKALMVDPKNGKVYMHLAAIDYQYDRYTFSRRTQYTKWLLDDAVQKSKIAVQLRPQDPEAYKTLTWSYYTLASYYQGTMNEEPGEVFEAGEKSIQRAIQLNPNDAGAYYIYGQLLWIQAQYVKKIGGDPAEVLSRGTESLRKAIRLNPKDFRPYHMMGNILFTKADWELENGSDPTQSADSSMKMLHKALEINPGLIAGYFSLATAASTKGKYLALTGHEPLEAFQQVESAFKDLLKINPKYTDALAYLAEASINKAEYSVDIKTDPSPYLADAKAATEECLKLDPNSLVCFRMLGNIDLVRARWKILKGVSAESEFRSSLQWLDRATNINHRSYSLNAQYLKAKLFLHWAEWKLKTGKDADTEIKQGLDMVENVLKLNPRFSEVVACRGVFLLFHAKSHHNNQIMQKAHSSFKEAFELNSNLTHTFEPYFYETEKALNQ